MNRFTNLLSALFLCFVPAVVHAQDADMADGMRAEGKIYVLVAIILVILAGLFYFLLRLDNKLTRLERSTEKKD